MQCSPMSACPLASDRPPSATGGPPGWDSTIVGDCQAAKPRQSSGGAFVDVVQTILHRARVDHARRRAQPRLGCLELQRAMWSLGVVVGDELAQDRRQMRLIEDDDSPGSTQWPGQGYRPAEDFDGRELRTEAVDRAGPVRATTAACLPPRGPDPIGEGLSVISRELRRKAAVDAGLAMARTLLSA